MGLFFPKNELSFNVVFPNVQWRKSLLWYELLYDGSYF